MIDKANMQGVMNVIRQAELANSRAADASLGISNEQQQSRFASDLVSRHSLGECDSNAICRDQDQFRSIR